MAKVWATRAFNFDRFDLFGFFEARERAGEPGGGAERGSTTVGSKTYATGLDLSFDGRTALLAGDDLRYDDPDRGPVVLAGKVRAIAGAFTADGSNADSGLRGISISLRDLMKAVESGSGDGTLRLLRNELGGDDTFDLSRQDDLARGFDGDDLMRGQGGSDRLFGGSGDDRLMGGDGDDRLYADEGRDALTGGLGKDRLFGGTDSRGDDFDFNGVSDSQPGIATRDVIFAFTSGSDHIDLEDIDARRGSGKADDRFDWSDQTARAYSAWWIKDGNGVLLRADVTGDAKADLEIFVSDLASLSKDDVLL